MNPHRRAWDEQRKKQQDIERDAQRIQAKDELCAALPVWSQRRNEPRMRALCRQVRGACVLCTVYCVDLACE